MSENDGSVHLQSKVSHPSLTSISNLPQLKFDEIVLESTEIQILDDFQEKFLQGGSLYIGQLLNGKRHGKGVMKYPNSR